MMRQPAVCVADRCCGGRPTHHRVLRGGAFNNNEENVGCARRNRNNPNNHNRNNGFRLVVVSTLFQPAGTARRVGDRKIAPAFRAEA